MMLGVVAATSACSRGCSPSRFALLPLGSSSLVNLEPSWHRRKRQVRQRLRAWLRIASGLTIGKRRRRRIRIVVGRLQAHHAWHPLDLPRALRRAVIMGWQCKECNTQNAHNAESCHICKKHWTEAWQGRRQNRPKSRSQNRPKKAKKDKSEEKQSKTAAEMKGKSAAEEWSIFPSQVPWVTSTPSTRVVNVKESETDQPLPPQPNLPVPPLPMTVNQHALSPDEAKLMQHLQGVKEFGELPPQMAEQLETLEQRHQESLNSKALTHAHLNKLHRVRNQSTQLANKIRALDEEWKKFLAESTARLTQHGQMFQAHRGELVQQYMSKIQELNAVKAEVTTASQSLMSQMPPIESPPELVDTAPELQGFQAMAQSLAVQEEGLVELSDGDDELRDATMEEPTKERPRRPIVARPFKAGTSPQKVNQHQLKQCQKRAAEAAKDSKEHKSDIKQDEP
eukprot:Skav220645  [mRNA]  locus=scaffold112:662698:664366:+ [translate_table: standard]